MFDIAEDGLDLEAAVSVSRVNLPDKSPQKRDLSEQALAKLPRHQAELYRMFGEAADDILYPKMVEKKKRPMNQKLRKKGGRAGFDDLWSTLRGDSIEKLMRADSKIPEELKDAYSAFARQGLSKGKPPVTRNFSSRVDIPDMDRLLDKSRVADTQEYRHHLGLMFRASTSNEDKMNVLMFNNPPPDLNNWAGQESIDRYLPSWAENWDKESEASYMKWLKIQQTPEGDTFSVVPDSELPTHMQKIPEEDENLLEMEETVGELNEQQKPVYGSEWDFLRKMKRNRPKTKEIKVQFLTEADTRTPGQFTKKFKDIDDDKNKPRQYVGPLPAHMKSVLGYDDKKQDGRQTTGFESSRYSRDSQSAPPGGQNLRFSTKWEPLSLNALEEYSEYQQPLGQGNYAQGQPLMFKSMS